MFNGLFGFGGGGKFAQYYLGSKNKSMRNIYERAIKGGSEI